MEYIYIGRIVSTHGIKGEIKIISDFKYKEKVFLKGKNIFIGDKKEIKEISTYRKHKNFDMITMFEYNNINQVLPFIKEKVYIDKSSLSLFEGEFLDSDLINMIVIANNEKIGRVISVRYASKSNKLIDIEINNKKVSIPYHKDFIKKIDLNNKTIEFNLIEGLI